MITSIRGNVLNVVIKIVFRQMIYTSLKKILEITVNKGRKKLCRCVHIATKYTMNPNILIALIVPVNWKKMMKK